MSPGVFRHELSRARTFGFMSDVEKLWKAGLALGADLTNTVAIGEDKVMNREGLRYPQEFVRHKMLDAVGDLSLAGAPLLGAYRSYKGGHRLNAMVLQELFSDSANWSLVQAPRTRARAHKRAARFGRSGCCRRVSCQIGGVRSGRPVIGLPRAFRTSAALSPLIAGCFGATIRRHNLGYG